MRLKPKSTVHNPRALLYKRFTDIERSYKDGELQYSYRTRDGKYWWYDYDNLCFNQLESGDNTEVIEVQHKSILVFDTELDAPVFYSYENGVWDVGLKEKEKENTISDVFEGYSEQDPSIKTHYTSGQPLYGGIYARGATEIEVGSLRHAQDYPNLKNGVVVIGDYEGDLTVFAFENPTSDFFYAKVPDSPWNYENYLTRAEEYFEENYGSTKNAIWWDLERTDPTDTSPENWFSFRFTITFPILTIQTLMEGMNLKMLANYQTNKYYCAGSFDYMIRGSVSSEDTQPLKGNIMHLKSFEIKYFSDDIMIDHDDLVVIDGRLYGVENMNYDIKRSPKPYIVYFATLNSIK